ncbi:hypothetical protein EON67_05980 [archaeon]|nr:MAG: hypothetical protein EON67_05980 [archaeon]
MCVYVCVKACAVRTLVVRRRCALRAVRRAPCRELRVDFACPEHAAIAAASLAVDAELQPDKASKEFTTQGRTLVVYVARARVRACACASALRCTLRPSV